MESNNPLSLYTISSFVILNDKGRRVYNRYYTNPFIKYEQYEKSKETGTNSNSTDVSLNKKKQVEYERIVYKKIKEQHNRGFTIGASYIWYFADKEAWCEW